MQQSKPVIGILPLIDIGKKSYWMLPGYMKGVLAAGGIPVMLPYTEDAAVLRYFARHYDGFLFPGGQDVNPDYYGQTRQTDQDEVCEPLDRMSLALFKEVRQAGRPALGICRGLQLFNVIYGGTLYQDLPTEHPTDVNHHQAPPYDAPAHRVSVAPGTLLEKIVGVRELPVNSLHHQAIKDVGNGLKVQAVSEDGIVESISDPEGAFLLAVQWHPECAFESDPKSLALFKALVEACRIA
ncbi:MAG: gamma-glutamyl-gamma-aminobutyrate hydrolase family protein [Pseudoramibacter sp.]